MQPITDREFAQFQRFIYEAAGITLTPAKKALVSGRLSKRVHARGAASYGDYFALLQGAQGAAEMQIAIDLLTTNETYFFREPRHFDMLRRLATVSTAAVSTAAVSTAAVSTAVASTTVASTAAGPALAARGQPRAGPQTPFRVWSAASSTGEEAYTAAMVLRDCLAGTRPFEIVGTDISTRVLERARTGHYSEQRARQIPDEYRKRFCLKGTGAQAGTLLVDRAVRAHVRFLHANLNAPLPDLGRFDVIFLRNVMIYFNGDTKRQVVERVLGLLKPGGHLFIGHSESLHGVTEAMRSVMPSVYRKP